MAKIFGDILLDGIRKGMMPARNREARKWYRNKARQATGVTSRDIMKTKEKARVTNSVKVGDMVFFKYDAKMKGKLPYWDAFPLIFPIKETSTHFYGLNMHYLPPKQRALLMNALYGLATDSSYDENTKLLLSYKTLNAAAKYKYFKPTFKMYLKSHVKSRFIKVHASEWDVALFLPVADFRGASSNKVYSDSRKIIRG